MSPLIIHPAIARALDILERDYARNWTLAELADSIGLTRTYLSGLFTAKMGTSPHAYLLHIRIQRAKQLLELSDLTITAIAVETGLSFASISPDHSEITPAERQVGTAQVCPHRGVQEDPCAHLQTWSFDHEWRGDTELLAQ